MISSVVIKQFIFIDNIAKLEPFFSSRCLGPENPPLSKKIKFATEYNASRIICRTYYRTCSECFATRTRFSLQLCRRNIHVHGVYESKAHRIIERIKFNRVPKNIQRCRCRTTYYFQVIAMY